MRLPFDGSLKVTQIFNDSRYRSSYTKFNLLGHNGIDYGCVVGTRILAPHGGKVLEAYDDTNGYGLYVKIENDREGSVLAHFSKFEVKIGDIIKEGQLVGLSGSTGNSTGPHLHWGYYWKPRNRDNGFGGFVDQDLVMDVLRHGGQEEIEKLTNELVEMRESRNKWKRDFRDLQDTHTKEIKEKQQHIESLQKTLSETNQNLTAMTKNFHEMSTRVRDLEADLEELKKIGDGDLNHMGELIDENDALRVLVAELEEKQKKKMQGYSNKELILELFSRIWR
jgi:septal ring factor EnvC (AmiA/AmiB activator)